jgi:hypothetical protein
VDLLIISITPDDPQALDRAMEVFAAVKKLVPASAIAASNLTGDNPSIAVAVPNGAEESQSEDSPKKREEVVVSLDKPARKRASGVAKKQSPSAEVKGPAEPPMATPPSFKELRSQCSDHVTRLWTTRDGQEAVKAILHGVGAKRVGDLKDDDLLVVVDKLQVAAGKLLA